jgi:hypothetical protein
MSNGVAANPASTIAAAAADITVTDCFDRPPEVIVIW